MNDNHKPKKVLHQLNIDEGAGGKPFAHFDSDTPFPTINHADEIRIVERRFRAIAIEHSIIESPTAIQWLITAKVTDLGEQ